VFCHQVTVAPAVVRRGGEVRAGGWLPDHVTLGVLEAHLPDEEIGELIEDFGCAEQRRRLLPAALAVRLVLAMTLLPDADVTEVIRRAAGLLEHLPWARPWHVPHPEALTRRRQKIPAELFEALFWQVAGPIAPTPEAPGMTWNGLLLCALDGFQVRVPDSPENREYFGSSGTADNSSPFPQARAIVVTAAGTRGALGLEFGPSSGGEQTLTRRLVEARPEIFGPGRLLLMDRNFPGFALIAQIRREGAHLLMRVKSDLSLPLEEALPDGTCQHRHRSHHHLPGRADHLRRRPHRARHQPGPGRHLLAAWPAQTTRKENPAQPGPWNRRPSRSDIRADVMPARPTPGPANQSDNPRQPPKNDKPQRVPNT
jgi:Insertion element 4 transposase N-terminal/Transposase DDE domain